MANSADEQAVESMTNTCKSHGELLCRFPAAQALSYSLEHTFVYPTAVGTWHEADLGRPIAASLERCAELLGVDLVAICAAAANVEPYVRADGTKVWSLMQLERQLRPEAYGRRRGGYLDRRRTWSGDAWRR